MKIRVGDTAKTTKVFTTEDVLSFSKLSTDNNPIHLDAAYAEDSIFTKPICHGFLVGSLISAVIATKLPGQGSIYLAQSLNFKKPVFHNDTVTATVCVSEIREEKKIVKLITVCVNQNEEVVIEGEAIIKVPFLS